MFRRLFQQRSRRQEINEEFEAHLAIEARLLEERGLSREQANVRARLSFGNRSLLAEETREAWIWVWLDRLGQDLRYAARAMRKSRSFTAAAVLSIALAIGAGTAVYSIADTVFLRPLPYPHPEQLMWVAVNFQKMKMEFLGSPEYVTWRRDNTVFESLAATQAYGGGTMLLNGENATEVHDARVSANFLKTFDVRPAMGREFRQAEELPNGPKAVLLTDHLWWDHFHGDADVVGKSIQIDGQAYTVIGILPRSFQFPMDVKLDILTTLPVLPTVTWHNSSVSTWAAYGRLKAGVSLSQARAVLKTLFERSKEGMPRPFRSGTELVVEPLQQHRIGNARVLLSVLISAVTCLLLIACANVSNLLLARWSARSGEFAIRAAIGAGRLRLARQLLTEAALLTMAGCAVGMLLAYAVLHGFAHYASNELPRMSEVRTDARVFVIGLIVSLFTTLIFSGLPSLRAGRFDIQRALQRSDRSGLVSGNRLIKQALVAAEIALCLILLAGAALLLQTLWHLRNDRLGFEPEHVLSIAIPLKGTKLEGNNRDALVSEFLDFIHQIPGTEAATQTECTPLSGGSQLRTFARADKPLFEAFHIGDSIHVCGTGAEYPRAAGLRISRGRAFSEADEQHPNTVALINDTAAQAFFPREDPVGKQILGIRATPNSPMKQWKTIVGVVSDSKNMGLDAKAAPQAFINGTTDPSAAQLQILVRSIADPHALESAISSKLHSMDPGLTAEFHPLAETISEMSGGARFNAILVSSFAAVAFLMAVIGVYGVLAYAVTQRTQEIGIRIALGGGRDRIFGQMLWEGIAPVVVGMAAGVATVPALGHALKAVLYGVSATDPTTFVLVAVALTITAVLAISIPARRASRVDPIVALRHQ